MAARLLQAALLPAVLGLLSLAAPMPSLQILPQLTARGMPVSWLAGRLQARAVQSSSFAEGGLQQVVLAAPPSAWRRGGQWQVALPRPAVTLQLQSGQRLLYAWRSPRIVIPRPPAAQAVAIILERTLPVAGLGRLLLDAGHMRAFQAGFDRGISQILLLDGEGGIWVTPRMLPAVRWQDGAASFQILQRVCQMGQVKTGQ
ncbi:hypothetical protein [Aquitalea aquatilis]|uniref:hypothetical protein n=1 Tax=Aquitalea aquatilis TaxID=1537400 RepID=UPI0010BDF4B4|nr:hypothetical protein [Aquitalea aquatilis]